VFDERLAERITDDVVSTCMQCGTKSDRISNCQEATCNMLLVQCENCANKYADCCSLSCREIYQLPIGSAARMAQRPQHAQHQNQSDQ
jgi:UPF0176 protein